MLRGSEHLLEGITPDGQIRVAAREAVQREMTAHFRPEFLTRIDDIVLFKPLTLDEIKQIVDLQTQDLRQRLAERGIRLEMTDEARDFVARSGFDPVYGARPLKRFLQHELETRIGRAMIAGQVVEGSTVEVRIEEGRLATAIRASEKVPAPA